MTRRAVLVTGASSGIGRAIALSLAADGYEVFGTVRDDGAGASLAAASGGAVTPILLDVTDAGQIAEAARCIGAATAGRGLHALINNAGIDLPGPLETFDLADLRRQMEVNVIGVAALTQALLPQLAAARGRVVNVGSVGARVVLPFNGPYSASKAALAAISTAWRSELRLRGVAVSLIEAGNVRTPIWGKVLAAAEAGARMQSQGPAAVYAPALARGRALSLRMEAAASEPRVVVRAVRRALDARHPRAHYRAGKDVALWQLLAWLLPASWLEAAFNQAFGLRRAV